MIVVISTLFTTSLLFNLQIAAAQQPTFDEEQISLITAIEDAFCDSTWRSEKKLTGFAHDLGITEGFNSMHPGINYIFPIAPPKTPAIGCCRKCKLDLDCVHTDSCCVQMFPKMADVTTNLFCSQPQLRPPSSDYINSYNLYLMLRGCSASAEEMSMNDSMRLMCENPEVYDNLDVKVPVTDIKQDVTYINRYCAYCNGKTDRDIVYWEPEVSCEIDSLLTTTPENVVVWISKTNSCNLIYNEPSAASDKVQKCDNYISSCNVTGHWADYDSLIEQACAAYTAPYNNAYKNVFCFLCNTNRDVGYNQCVLYEDAGGPPLFDPEGTTLSFSALLRFRPKEDNTNEGPPMQPKECFDNQIYDGFKDMCRNITCYPPRTYRYGTCVSPFETLSGIWYRCYIKLTPVQELIHDNFEPNHIKDSILRWMKSTTVPLNTVSICLYLKPNAQPHGKQLVPDYYLAEVDIIITTGYNVQSSFIERIFALENKKVSVPYYTDFYPTFVLAELQKENELDLYIFDSIQGEMLIRLNDENEKDNDYFKQLPPLEVMIPPKVCPLVKLSISELEIERFTWGFSILDVKKNISRAMYIEIPDQTRQNNTIFVCKSLFEDITGLLMLKYPKRDTHMTSDVPQGILSLVCTCLSVFCSLLTLATYALFKELRTQPGINNIMLIINLICAQILFQFGAGQAENVTELGCKVLGVLVHFSWLLTIMWMNVCSLHMFRVFKSLAQKPTGTSIVKTTFAYSGYCIVISSIPVAATVTASVTKYGDSGYGGHICYISHYDMVQFTFALPVGVIIFTNISLFLSVIVIITKLPKLDGNSTKSRNFAKIYIKLSTLTGLTWVFGFVFAFTGVEVLEYIFIVLNAGIGVFIFLAFVCNKRVFKLYNRLLQPKRIRYTESTKLSSLSKSTSRCDGVVQS